MHLRAGPTQLLWTGGHLSWVGALELVDGQRVVVKIRDPSRRLGACHRVHSVAWSAGFPCAEPITPPLPLEGKAASAEVYTPGGRPGRWDDPWLSEQTAQALRRLIYLAAGAVDLDSLEPPPPWTGWLDPSANPWPPPDKGPPLNDHPTTEPVRELAIALNARLRATSLPLVVGHSDWYQGNLRWDDGGQLFAADDWDSIAALPEAAFAGCAAVSFLPSPPDEDESRPGARVEQIAAFLDDYERARGRPFTTEETEIAWAAGLWQRVFDAAKALATGRPVAAADQVRDAKECRRRADC